MRNVSFTLLGSLTTLVAVAACGGESFSHGSGDSAGGGGAFQGGTTNGGTPSTGGIGDHAGTASGGLAGAVGAAATGATGGKVNEACDALPRPNSCDRVDSVWYHDPQTGACTPYGSCSVYHGDPNRYDSLDACQKACPGSAETSCQVPTDCIVLSPGCCGTCDSPNVTAGDLIALNKAYPGAGCGVPAQPFPGGSPLPTACAPCAMPAPGQGTLEYFVPDCVAGRCVVNDIRTSYVTACKTDNECVLRAGTGCCESCTADDEVSIRNDGSLQKLVCGNQPINCPACDPPPSGATPICGPDGHCSKVYPL